MQYYRWFPGDYIRDTRRLTMLQHGAYRILLDEYMVGGKPLPNDLPTLYRVCMALSGEEQAAVRYVLEEFFRLDGPHWKHKRCDEELAHQRERSDAAKRSVAARESRRQVIERSSNDPSNVDRTIIERSIERSSIQNQRKDKEHSSVVTDGFARFWATWPTSGRKVAKAECAKRWRMRGLEAQADVICKHVESSKSSKQWREGYEPAPLTYLNQRRWEDAAEPMQADEWAGAL
ncbi:MAG: DUF1376 domain-containing protein [Leptolyngbyaceae bacterium]|nr:DUF1376 domain-containing protein [Leptolyngbyaceae bacterium]